MTAGKKLREAAEKYAKEHDVNAGYDEWALEKGFLAGARWAFEQAAQEMDSFDKNGANANCWMRGTLMKRIRQLADGGGDAGEKP